MVNHLRASPGAKSMCTFEDVKDVTAQLISAFGFATQRVQSLFFLNSKFQGSSLLL